MTQLQCSWWNQQYTSKQGIYLYGAEKRRARASARMRKGTDRAPIPSLSMHPCFLLSSKVNNAHVVTSKATCLAEKRETMIKK